MDTPDTLPGVVWAADAFYDYFGQLGKNQVPIVYSSNYNISFMGLEKLHPFDSCKYARVVGFLGDSGTLSSKRLVEVKKKPTKQHLLSVHTKEYLKSLKSSTTVAQVTELPFLAAVPQTFVQSQVLNPFLFATSGTILAASLAVKRGWSINVGGGFHHCNYNEGGGFCAYSDITLSYRYAREHFSHIKKIMIIDCDAHQGNGHANDKLHFKDQSLFIVDFYNPRIYPGDKPAKKAIDVQILATDNIQDAEYLTKLDDGLDDAFSEWAPDLIIYNAGTDIMDGDPLGNMGVSAKGVAKRDEMVFAAALKRKIPIVMVLSGGYQASNALAIADSITNLNKKFDLISPETGVDESKLSKDSSDKKDDSTKEKKEPAAPKPHSGKWHASYEDCSVISCAYGLGVSNIGTQHWGCCYCTDPKSKNCKK